MMGYFGRRQVRVEDDLLVTGRGQYVDDLKLTGMLHVALLRSTMAHARLRAVDVSRAREAKGVVAVFTVEDLPPAARLLADCHAHPALAPKELPTLATDKVRYVGEPIAAVVAESRYLAEDAAELTEVDYDPLPAVIDLEKAMEVGAPLVHDDRPNNIATRLPIIKGDTARAFAQAHCVVKERLEIHRGAGQAMETRGIVASWSAADQRLTVWNVSQVPFLQRSVIAAALGLPEYRVRVLNGEVGGGFGYKGLVYVEDILIPAIAWKIGRPVKWIEDRHVRPASGGEASVDLANLPPVTRLGMRAEPPFKRPFPRRIVPVGRREESGHLMGPPVFFQDRGELLVVDRIVGVGADRVPQSRLSIVEIARQPVGHTSSESVVVLVVGEGDDRLVVLTQPETGDPDCRVDLVLEN